MKAGTKTDVFLTLEGGKRIEIKMGDRLTARYAEVVSKGKQDDAPYVVIDGFVEFRKGRFYIDWFIQKEECFRSDDLRDIQEYRNSIFFSLQKEKPVPSFYVIYQITIA